MQHFDPMPKSVAEAVNAVMGTVTYVQKRGQNDFHRYKFAAIGDILDKLQPAMHEAGLIVTQDEVKSELIADGSVMVATYEFSLSHKSGETWAIRPKHTGMASAKNSKGGFDDKALNKCHTAARKYFLLGLFQIPTGEHDDPDYQEDRPAAKNDKPANQDAPKAGATASRPKQPEADNPQRKKALEWARVVAGQIESECGNVEAIDELMRQPAVVKGVAALRENHADICDDLLERMNKRRMALSNQQAAE